MKKETKNLSASVHFRLKRLARDRGRPFQELFYYYAFERFLYRLSCSQYSDIFVLKGGLMFIGWGISLRRPTTDIDVQGYLANTIENLVVVVKHICLLDVEADGMWFNADSVRGERIMNDADYSGVRIYFTGYLGPAEIYLHLDVSFANVITPEELLVEYPSLLDMPNFKIRGYPYETAIAEKFQAMVALDVINDRMKDFYDIWLLSQQVDIPGEILMSAIQATFRRRNTPLPSLLPIALSDDFAYQRRSDWESFLKRSGLDILDQPSFNEVIPVLRELLWPVVQASVNDRSFEYIWKAGGSWKAV